MTTNGPSVALVQRRTAAAEDEYSNNQHLSSLGRIRSARTYAAFAKLFRRVIRRVRRSAIYRRDVLNGSPAASGRLPITVSLALQWTSCRPVAGPVRDIPLPGRVHPGHIPWPPLRKRKNVLTLFLTLN